MFSERRLDSIELVDIQNLMYGSQPGSIGSATAVDIQRWHEQGFQFCSQGNFPSLPYGLSQKKGGPCGILASIQAEIFKDVYFLSYSAEQSVLHPDQLLLRAILRVLQRSAAKSIQILVPVLSDALLITHENVKVISCDSMESAFSVLQNQLLDHLKSAIGCILFLMSLILTR